jgi:predicted AAA+ superfamily ATPase
MIRRELIDILKNDLKEVPAIMLFGPRQAGKTTLVKKIAAESSAEFLYLDMESPSDKNKLDDPELFLTQVEEKTVIVDEVQLIPSLFPVLRTLIDKKRKAGRFLLLGSASPELIQHSSESLAGRVRYRELFPFSLEEVGKRNQNTLWLRGGFPEAFLSKNDEQAAAWLKDFIYSYASRDLRALGLSLQERQVTRLMQMLAHQHGQLLNYSSLAKSLGISVPSITKAAFYLEEAMLIRTLQPWHFNTKKRLVKTPKVYIRDTGMLHNLLFLHNFEQLMGHPQVGNSWEGFVIQQILTRLPQNIQPWFYRSQDGSEIDLILSKANGILAALEIKLSDAPKITRGNTEAVKELSPKHSVIITPQADTYPIKGGWMVYGLDGLLKDMDRFKG